MALDEQPVPMKVRWQVWTDEDGQRFGASHGSRTLWFWAASGPRGHSSGAERDPHEAVKRAQLAAMQLDRAED